MVKLAMFDHATRPQVDAATPGRASWVSANAGSGKTRVLTDRVARLLLAGAPPQRILCLTFTIAAAANMQVRLFDRLGEWSMLSDTELKERLLGLGEPEDRLNEEKFEEARTLFARALETPGGLKIQTIHAFSSSLLRRFPREAGVSPRFEQIDDRTSRKLQDTILDMLAVNRPDIYRPIARMLAERNLTELTNLIAAARHEFVFPFEPQNVLREFGLVHEPDATQETRAHVKSLLAPADVRNLEKLMIALNADAENSGSRKMASAITSILQTEWTQSTLFDLTKCFLTGEGASQPFSPNRTPRQAVTAGLGSDLNNWLAEYKRRVQAARIDVINVQAAEKTLSLHRFAEAFLSHYEEKKHQAAQLDFNDLIHKALALLQNREFAQWVLFRLDGGIDHVLIDEAQDVSPIQWKIVSEITREFTTGLGARDLSRTVFAVGDEKQSIYGFQGAAPEKFTEMCQHFQTRFRDAGLKFVQNELHYSFRSSSIILRAVDAIFKGDLTPGFVPDTKHLAFKDNLPGRVDCWPFLAETKKSDSDGDWFTTVPQTAETPSHVKLAQAITERVSRMFNDHELLPGDQGGRLIRPGDILILVRRRSALFFEIINRLKIAGLPVAGADRLKLAEELAVRDLTSILAFLANHQDNLALAEALRSPLFGLSESQLFAIAYDRGKHSLWESLEQNNEFRDTADVIIDLIDVSGKSTPYGILERILTFHRGREKLIARLGHEVEEAIDSYLQQALRYDSETSISLVGFLNLLTTEFEVKRQLDQTTSEIRVMTIHGAKGLEAPIVILPDTEESHSMPTAMIELSDPDRTPLFMVKKSLSPPPLVAARDARKQRESEEAARLLYVALTRAECWLIICGEGTHKPGCWYDMIASGLRQCGADPHDFCDESSAFVGLESGLRLASDDWPRVISQKHRAQIASVDLPGWAHQRVNIIPTEPDSLSPSRLGGGSHGDNDEIIGDSESRDAAARFGDRLHLLLEHLPGIARAKRPTAAKSILALDDPTADAAAFQDCITAALELLDDPAIAFLFDHTSMREAGFTAASPTLNDRKLHGFIDNLLVRDDKVVVVDYKSNKNVPKRPEDVPEYILRQMGAYRDVMAEIFPGKDVETAILWTRNRTFMPVPAELCAAALERAASSLH